MSVWTKEEIQKRILALEGGTTAGGGGGSGSAASQLGWFNVKDYGAVGNDSTDDTAAIMAAHHACISFGGGIVYFPWGWYAIYGDLLLNSTDARAHWLGVGMYEGNEFFGSVLRGKSGASVNPVVSVVGSSGSNHGSLELDNIGIDGSGSGGRDNLLIDRGSVVNMHRFSSSFTSGRGMHIRELWNAKGENIFVYGCGSPTKPAILFDTHPGDAQAGSDKVQWNLLHCFACAGIELQFGDTANGDAAPTADVQITNFTAERTPQTDNHPIISFDYAQNCKVIGGTLRINGGSDPSTLVKQGGTGTGYPNQVNAVMFDSAGSPQDYIDHTVGRLQVVACSFLGNAPSRADYHIGSAVNAGDAVTGGNFSVHAVTKLLSDERSFDKRPHGHRDVERYGNISTAAATASIGSWLAYDFLDGATNDWVGVIQVPEDCAPGSPAVLRLWYTGSFSPGANQVVVLNWLGQSQPAPGSLAAGSTTYAQNLTIPSGFIVNTLTKTEITGPTTNSGELLQVRLQRIGADAADTYTGNWRLARVELVYAKLL